jgi:hypothetical protein
MKASALIASIMLAAGVAFMAGLRVGQDTLKRWGAFLARSSPVRNEVCAALATRVFSVADEVLAARMLGKSAKDLERIMPNQNWSYEPRDGGFIIRWKLSYDDDLRYESWSDSVLGTHDFEDLIKREEVINPIVGQSLATVTISAFDQNCAVHPGSWR